MLWLFVIAACTEACHSDTSFFHARAVGVGAVRRGLRERVRVGEAGQG